MDALLTVVGVALLAWTAVATVAALGIRGAAHALLACVVVASAVVVGSAIALSAVDALTRTGWLVGEAAAAVVATAAWWRRGCARRWSRPRVSLPRLRTAAASHPAAAAAGGAAAVAACVQLYVGLRVVPNNWDSMTYHLSRAAYWLQYESARHFPGGTSRQLESAPNAELLQAWTMSMTGGDGLVHVVQWLALIGTGVGVYAGARLLSAPRHAAVFAAAVFVLLPQPLLQSTTTQNDLVCALFVVCAVVFLVRGLRDRRPGDLVIAGAATGLAIGTKGTALFLLGALALLAAATVVASRPPRRVLLTAAVAVVAGTVALGAFNYVLNANRTGSPFGSALAQTGTGAGTPAIDNVLAHAWTFVDNPGVTWSALDRVAVNVSDLLPDRIVARLGPVPDAVVGEDTSAFGLVGWLVLPLVLAAALVGRRPDSARRALAASVLIVGLVMAVRLGWNPWLGRIYIPLVAVAAPLLAVAVRRSGPAWLVLALAVVSASGSLALNLNKPLLAEPGKDDVFALDPIQQRTLPRPNLDPAVRWVARELDPAAPLGYVGGGDSWDFPFFGDGRRALTRRIVRFPGPEFTTYENMRANGLAGVLYVDGVTPPPGVRAQRISVSVLFAPARP